MEFEPWCDAIDLYFRHRMDIAFDITKDTGRDCWRDMFNDGLTPEQAAAEEVSNWDGEE